MKTYLLALALSCLAAGSAHAIPICVQFNVALTAPDSPHGIGADAVITVRQEDWDGQTHRYMTNKTIITGAITLSCDGTYQAGDTEACGMLVTYRDGPTVCE